MEKEERSMRIDEVDVKIVSYFGVLWMNEGGGEEEVEDGGTKEGTRRSAFIADERKISTTSTSRSAVGSLFGRWGDGRDGGLIDYNRLVD